MAGGTPPDSGAGARGTTAITLSRASRGRRVHPALVEHHGMAVWSSESIIERLHLQWIISEIDGQERLTLLSHLRRGQLYVAV